MAGEKIRHPCRCRAALETGKRDVGREFAPLRLEAERIERRAHLFAQPGEPGLGFDRPKLLRAM